MASSEWYQVEAGDGPVSAPGMATEFANLEAGQEAARQAAPDRPEECLTLVKYTRTELRTFTKTVSIVEADVL